MDLSVKQLQGMIEIFTELETDRILGKTVQKVSELLPAKGCSIFLYDENSDTIRLAESTSNTEATNQSICYRRGEGLTGYVFKTQKPLIIQDLDKKNDETLQKEFGDSIYLASKFVEGATSVAKSYLAVPMLSNEGRFLGILRSSSYDTNFGQNDLELMIHIAGYISKALTNSDRYLKQQIKANYFKLLTEFGTKLHSYYSIDELFAFVAKQAAATFSAETCEIYIQKDDDPNLLILKAGYGIPKELINLATHQVGEGLTGTLVKENRIIRLKNVLNFKKYKGKYRLKMKQNLKYGDRLAFLGIPICIKSNPMGAIKLYNKIPRYTGGANYFSLDDEKYLAILADMLSVAIENHQYRESMRNSAMQIIKNQRLTALGTMAIRLPNEFTNTLSTAQLQVNNMLRKLTKNKLTADETDKKLNDILLSLKQMATGINQLQEFSTKAGFLKTKRPWQEIIDEGLLFLNQEFVHKKIKITRNRSSEENLPKILVEPNEMIEVIINLLIIAISNLKHYESDLTIRSIHTQNPLGIKTYIRSEDNLTVPLYSKEDSIQQVDYERITPHSFMLNVAKEIVINNYKGTLVLTPHKIGLQIELFLPLEEE